MIYKLSAWHLSMQYVEFVKLINLLMLYWIHDELYFTFSYYNGNVIMFLKSTLTFPRHIKADKLDGYLLLIELVIQ